MKSICEIAALILLLSITAVTSAFAGAGVRATSHATSYAMAAF